MSLRGQQSARDRILASQGDADRMILVEGATILTMAGDEPFTGDVLIRGVRIVAVGDRLAERAGDAIRVDASRCILLPGLVDSHVHAWEGQLRGIAPDADFGSYMALTHDGLARHYRPEDIAIGERLTVLQALNSGTTTIVDNSHNSRSRAHSEAAIEALLSSGIRAVYAAGSAQAGAHEGHLPGDLLRLRSEYFESGQDRVTLRMFDIQPSVDTWRFARENGFGVCAEMGSWIPNLDELVASGLMGPDHSYNHCADISAATWDAIAESGAAVNLVPRSDSHFGLGAFAPVLEAQRRGIRIGISSDNEISYQHDLFTEMRTLLTVQRGLSFAAEFAGDATALPRYRAIDVLHAATVGGAANAGLMDEIGTVEVGKRADLILISLDDVGTRLWGSAVGTVVNFASAATVDAVFLDGDVRKWDGGLIGVDVDALISAGEESRAYLLERFGTDLAAVRSGLHRTVDEADTSAAVTSILAGSGH
ncbi:amidohydrolase family protein [Microbacterium sp. RD1]|uniref:amidohydrolase family protein n=1 Tax=Microbacterium sp. RD1 TaxID=3457313 RepID=UPI003FA55697